MTATVEFTVEPFTEGDPGDHVSAALAAVRAEGCAIEVGPFGSSFTCPADRAAVVVERLTAAAVGAGATRVSVQVTIEPT
ncbi:MAG: thiamine-binding protein [Acidimicrobiia bacterium]